MEYLFIYLLQLTDIITGLAILLSTVPIILQFIRWSIKEKGTIFDKEYSQPIIICWIIAFILLILPTKQTMLLMGGTYLGKKAVNAVVTDEKIQKIDTIINLQLDRYIKELQQ